jgi:rare lipoprotein A (peptidoglycan hydrolase)
MPMRRTIGISLAFLMISTGAIAKTPEERTSYLPAQLDTGKSGKTQARHGKTRFACSAVHFRSHTRRTAYRGRRVRQWYADAPSGDSASGAQPDTYLGPVSTIGRTEFGRAAWYNFVGGRTSSGEILDGVTPTAAHRSLPLASYAKVTNLDNGRAVIVKINDRGPVSRRFIIDLSPGAARSIDVTRTGIAAVTVEPVEIAPAPPAATVTASQTSPASAVQ